MENSHSGAALELVLHHVDQGFELVQEAAQTLPLSLVEKIASETRQNHRVVT